MKNNELVRLNPVERYAAPKIPTLAESRENAEMLKKLPSRWQQNAKVLACIGIIGAMTLSSFANVLAQPPNAYNAQSGYAVEYGEESEIVAESGGYSEFDLETRFHWGGVGIAFYVIYITEQEALNIIRAQLEAAGLNFGTTPPDYTAGWQNIGLDLFDEDKGVAIAQLERFGENARTNWKKDSRDANHITGEFAEQTDLAVGVFYTPGVLQSDIESEGTILGLEWEKALNPLIRDEEWVQENPFNINWFTPEAQANARTIIRENLTTQANEFIAFLQSEGIIGDSPQEIAVTLNGTPIEFDDIAPMFVNNRIMVPFRTVFELLEFEIEWTETDRGAWRDRRAIITKDDIRITLDVGANFTRVSGVPGFRELNPHAVIRNNRLMIPPHFIAEALGATVEWSEDLWTIVITTND